MMSIGIRWVGEEVNYSSKMMFIDCVIIAVHKKNVKKFRFSKYYFYFYQINKLK